MSRITIHTVEIPGGTLGADFDLRADAWTAGTYRTLAEAVGAAEQCGEPVEVWAEFWPNGGTALVAEVAR